MSEIKAFVAHSFLDDDKELIGTFLEYFTQIKQMGIGFTWDHAKTAEPKELDEKVLGLIQDKNLFIGICTKNERAISPVDLKCGLVRKTTLRADESKYLWKTSDWIIQEIGLAIGRGLKLILLIEDGLRSPGALQGNTEYIPFSRQFPEQSFGKLLEMISSLRPKAITAPAPETAIQVSQSQAEASTKEDDDWILNPKPDWGLFIYQFALVKAISTDRAEVGEILSKAYLESPEGREPYRRESWEAFAEYQRLRLGKGGRLDQMLKLSASYPANDQVRLYLGLAYELYEEHEKAAVAYNLAAEMTTDGAKRVEYLGKTALAHLRAGKKTESQTAIDKMKQEGAQTSSGESIVVEALQEIAALDADNDMYFGLTERALEIKPDDVDARFSLAYKYSQEKEDELCFFHYLRIPKNQRSAMTWNNLGVQYEHFQLSSSSVKAYRTFERPILASRSHSTHSLLMLH